MGKQLLIGFCLLIATVTQAVAEEIVLGLSKDTVSINTSFDGSEILIFGAVKRESQIIYDPRLQVIITVAGPNEPFTVRRKEKRFGIWINTDAVDVDSAPTFYAVSTSTALGFVGTCRSLTMKLSWCSDTPRKRRGEQQTEIQSP